MRKSKAEQQHQQQITEQSNYALPLEEDAWGYVASGSDEDIYWRQLTGAHTYKDLASTTYLEMHQLAYEAWQSNPLAATIIELTNSFVLGKGLTIEASNKRVKQILMEFWHTNEMDERIYHICQELALYGEIFVRFFINPYDGSTKIRLLDPSRIDQIETDPDDIETQLRFHYQALNANNMPQEPEGVWYEAGTEVIQFAVNKVSNAKRGRSDLAPILPWLRRYKDWLIDRVRINKYKGAFLWDVQLQGADRKALDRKRLEYSYPPEPGSIIIHNESEKWTAIQPAINANDAKEDGRAIKLMIAVGAGLPEFYLSDSSYGNRATAAEMGLPAMLKYQRRQRIVKRIIRTILNRVIVEATRAGHLGRTTNTTYDVIFPEIDNADHQLLATTCKHLTDGLSTAKAQGWISDETAMRLLFQIFGADIDVHEERERIVGH